MSIRAIAWVLEQDIKEPLEKYVLVILANFAGDTGMAYPSTETISRVTSLSQRSVIRLLDRLVEQRWVEDTGKRTGRTKRVKVYRLSAAAEGLKGASQSVLKRPKTDSQSPLNTDPQSPLNTDCQAPNTDCQSPVILTGSQSDPLKEPLKEPIVPKIEIRKLSEVVEALKEDPRFDGLDLDFQIKRALAWAKKKNKGVSERFLRYWLDNADRDLEEDDDEELYHEEPYYSWDGWTDERVRALRELWPGAAEPPTRWEKLSGDVKRVIEARVKEGWT